MKKIAYIELDTHAEIAGNFLELMRDSDVFTVDYYFSRKIMEILAQQSENIFEVTHRNILNQLKHKMYDLVIIGTVHRYFNVFQQIIDSLNTSVIVHNLNFSRATRLCLLFKVLQKDAIYRLKLLCEESLLSAPRVYQKANNLLVLDEVLIKNNPAQKLKFLPVFYTDGHKNASESVETIVIPGTVSQQRRDYRHILNCLKKFNQVNQYHFVFLGKASGEELQWLKDFEGQKPQHVSIKYFTERVSQPVFDEWMQRADILWCPLQQETEFFSQKEYYGITKMSGNVGDAIKYGKLAIFPADYPNSHPFIIPENNNIEEQIYTYHKWMEYDFEQNFAKEKVLKSLEEKLAEFI
ncbi:hypothetical protein CO230_07860 [Chryseobacterium sp. 6424]|uniref:hypothetical protein n=1 Tax=Chryseobacterium sp. 6424 TaxID=2039166 RepID=UPI000EFCFE06|nr:hypothetical protein [Chryseobacterium sp. 6424]AYO58045.1 hypothetical protein CO230_07860 [Chryseobacterium sp. 6424]